MKKYLIILLVLVFSIPILGIGVGCKEEEVAEETFPEIEEGAVLNFPTPWVSGGDDAISLLFYKIVEDFETLYPGVKVNIEPLPWEGFNPNLITWFAAGDAPDIAIINDNTFGALANEDFLLPLDDYIDIKAATEGYNKVQTETIPSMLGDGKTRGLITTSIYYLFWYQTDILGSAGYDSFPGSLEEFKTMITDVNTEDVSGLGLVNEPGGGINNRWEPIIWTYGLGGDYWKDGRPNFTSPEVILAISTLKELYDNGYTTKETNWSDKRKLMATNNIATMTGTATEWDNMLVVDPDIKMENFNTATFWGENQSSTTALQTMVADKDTDYPVAAAKFIEFFNSYKYQREMLEELGITVARIDVMQDPEVVEKMLTNRPLLEGVLESASNTKLLMPPDLLMLEDSNKILETWCIYYDKVIYEDMDVTEAMEAAEAEVLEILGL